MCSIVWEQYTKVWLLVPSIVFLLQKCKKKYLKFIYHRLYKGIYVQNFRACKPFSITRNTYLVKVLFYCYILTLLFCFAGTLWGLIPDFHCDPVLSFGPLYVQVTKDHKIWPTDSFAKLPGKLGLFKTVDSGVTHTSSNNAVRVKKYVSVALQATPSCL